MSAIRVLLADDHAIVREGIRKTVEEIPEVRVVGEAGDGPQVMAGLEQHRPDCLIIDVTMPEFDPIPAIRGIRARFPEMKILVVSAYDDDIYVQGLMSAGVNGYHLKDQPLNDLRRALERILAGELWISPPLINKLVRKPQEQLPPLTVRQRELLGLLRDGKDNQSIAREMGLSIKTIENHLTRLYRQLNVQSRLEAVNFVMKNPQVLGTPGMRAGAAPAPAPVPPGGKPISVMIVDDNGRYREHLQWVIGKVCPRATIYEAEDIRTAVHMAQRITPELILIDVVLGDEDGISCARQIKAGSAQSRIVLISAYPDREFHRLGLQAGAVAFLDKKDLDLAALRQVIEDVL